MSESIETAKFKKELFLENLPKNRPFTRFFIVSGWASILGLIYAFFQFEKINFPVEHLNNVFAWLVCGFTLFLLYLVVSFKLSKSYLYAEILPHIHFVNHACRDFIASADNQNEENFKNTISQVLDAISECFSLTERRKCTSSIKIFTSSSDEDDKTLYVTTFYIDSISKSRVSSIDKGYCAPAESYSSIKKLFDDENSRFYVKQNLMRAYCNRDYEHPYIEDIYEETGKRPKSILGLWFLNWPLPIKSTIVAPINFQDNFGEDNYMGFICVDSESRNSFKHKYTPELVAAFADALFMIMKIADDKNLH